MELELEKMEPQKPASVRQRLLQRRRLVLVLTVSAILLVSIVGIVCVLLNGSHQPEQVAPVQALCEYQLFVPEFDDETTNKKMMSFDGNGLMRLSSYISRNYGTYSMAQKVNSFTVHTVGLNRRILSIYMNCSTVFIHLNRDVKGNLISEQIEMLALNSKGLFAWCTIRGPIVWSGKNQHYRCDVPRSFRCAPESYEASSYESFWWHMVSFEFEVEPIRERAERGLWSSERSFCYTEPVKDSTTNVSVSNYKLLVDHL